MHVKNTSKRAIAGPLKLRVTGMTSPSGEPVLIGADHGDVGPGAVLDFSSLVEGGTLAPGASTNARRLTIRLDRFTMLKPGRRGGWSHLIDLDARVYGRRKAS
jgi:hypothetical protein